MGNPCRIAGVRRSVIITPGWEKVEQHAIREELGYQDCLLLKSIYDAYRGKVGYCTFYMVLTKLLETPMNHKKNLRLMRKFDLLAKIRRAKPYKQLEKYTK